MLKTSVVALCASFVCLGAASQAAHAGVFFTNDADFTLAAGPLSGFEDFEEGDVPVGGTDFAAPLDSTTDNGIFSPGDIAPGLALRDQPGPGSEGLIALDAGSFGALSNVVGTNLLADELVLEFSVPVDAVGFNAFTFLANDPALEISFFNGAILLDSTVIASDQTTSYVGYLSGGDFITSILLSSSNNRIEFVDNISFGVSGLVQLPEPATSLLFSLGLAGLFLARRRLQPGHA